MNNFLVGDLFKVQDRLIQLWVHKLSSQTQSFCRYLSVGELFTVLEVNRQTRIAGVCEIRVLITKTGETGWIILDTISITRIDNSEVSESVSLA